MSFPDPLSPFPLAQSMPAPLPAPHQPVVAGRLGSLAGHGQGPGSLPAGRWPRDHGGAPCLMCWAPWLCQSTFGQGVTVTGSHISRGGRHTGHASTHLLATSVVTAQQRWLAARVSRTGHPLTPGRDRAGPVAVPGRGRLRHAGNKEAVLGTGWLCCAGAEQPSEILIILHSFLTGGTVPEETARTCPICPALLSVTQLLRLKVKLLGTQHCSRAGLEPLGLCRERNGSPPALGTQEQQPYFIATETETLGYRGMLGLFWARPPPRQQSGVSGHPSHLPCSQQGPQLPLPQAWISQ